MRTSRTSRLAAALAATVIAGGLFATAATTSASAAAPTASRSTSVDRTDDSGHDAPRHARLHGQTPVVGFFRDREIRYLDEGPVALATKPDGSYFSDVDPIWAVTNGVAGQHNIIDNVPGLNSPDDYTPLWQVVTVTWKSGAHKRLLDSAADVAKAEKSGLVTLNVTSTIVNCPVLGFGQKVTHGFFRSTDVRYLDEGVIGLATNPDGTFVSDVDPIWVVTNGSASQKNIIDDVPNLNAPDDYTPLWQVVTVTWAPGVNAVTLTSRADVETARAQGWVTLTTTSTVVNCPVL